MTKLYKEIDNYYSDKIKKHGATPKGVDWNGEEGQFTRFEKLSKIIKTDSPTVNDVGCGYGKYLEYLIKNYTKFQYRGYDLSNEMIKKASNQYPNYKFFHITSLHEMTNAEYSVSSGIFNVKMKFSDTKWLSYILDTLEQINLKSDKGFSFNILNLKECNKKFIKNHLYYADLDFFYNFCRKNFSKNILALDNYNLHEFTILVKK
jgi:SAM-dependent methyltransferase